MTFKEFNLGNRAYLKLAYIGIAIAMPQKKTAYLHSEHYNNNTTSNKISTYLKQGEIVCPNIITNIRNFGKRFHACGVRTFLECFYKLPYVMRFFGEEIQPGKRSIEHLSFRVIFQN